MFSKSTLFFAFLAVAKLVVATPPACLLAAINAQDEPADLKSICGSHALDVQNSLAKMCGSNRDDALKAFTETCKGAGVTVSSYAISATMSAPLSTGASAKPTTMVYISTFFDSSCSCTKTAAITSVNLAAPSGLVTSTPTNGSITTPTTPTASATFTNAASKAELGSLAAVAIAAAVLVIAL